MIHDNKKSFYLKVGQALTIARQRANMSITQLSKKSGEHHKTIEGIESGRPFYLHQAIWMKNILGIDIYNIKDIGGKDHGKKDIDVGLKSFI